MPDSKIKKKFVSPFTRDIEENKLVLLEELGLKRIEDLPVFSLRVTTGRGGRKTESVIKVSKDTQYEAALLLYLLKKYGSKTEQKEGCLAIELFMAAEALLFYIPGGGERGIGIMMPPLISHLFHGFDVGPIILFEYEPDH